MAHQKFFIRKNLIIQKKLQLRYMWLVLLSVILVSAVIVLSIYVSYWSLISEKMVSSQVKILFEEMLKNMNALLLFEIPIVLFLVGFASIVFSHKVAGPVYRLEQAACEVAKGDLTSNVRLRGDDELKNLSNVFNSVVDNINLLVKKDQKLITDLSDLTDTLYQNLKDKKISKDDALVLISKLNDLVGELKTLIMQYKIEKS